MKKIKDLTKKQKNIILISLLVVAVAIIVVLCVVLRKKAQNKKVETEVRTTKAFESVFTQSIDISGYLEANDKQKVQFRSTGAITGVFVKQGDIVKKGDLLATIDDTTQRYSLERATQEIEKNRLTASEKELKLLEMSYNMAKNELEYTKAVASFDGVVAEVNIAVGDYAKAAETLGLMTVVDLSVLKAKIQVDEIDVKLLKEGQKVYLDFDSLPNTKVEAVISYIPMLGEYDASSGIGVKKVELTIENPPEGLYPGYSFSATIKSSSDTKYLMVPSSCVKSQRSQSYVVVKREDGKLENVNVTVRYLGEGLSQILSGDVKSGDDIVANTPRTRNSNMMPGVPGVRM